MTLENLKKSLAAWKEKGNEEKVKKYELLLEKKLKKIELFKNDPSSPYFKYRNYVEEKPKVVKEDGKTTKR